MGWGWGERGLPALIACPEVEQRAASSQQRALTFLTLRGTLAPAHTAPPQELLKLIPETFADTRINESCAGAAIEVCVRQCVFCVHIACRVCVCVVACVYMCVPPASAAWPDSGTTIYPTATCLSLTLTLNLTLALTLTLTPTLSHRRRRWRCSSPRAARCMPSWRACPRAACTRCACARAWVWGRGTSWPTCSRRCARVRPCGAGPLHWLRRGVRAAGVACLQVQVWLNTAGLVPACIMAPQAPRAPTARPDTCLLQL